MRRLLLISLAVFLAATLASVSLFFVPETSRAAPPPSEGGPSQGTFTEGTAEPYEPSLVDGTGPGAFEADDKVVATKGRATRWPIVRAARRFIGTRYRYSTCTRSRMSCTCLTKKTWAKFGHKLPMTEGGQWKYRPSKRIWKKSNLRRGDIVFFKEGAASGRITHVGIYSGRGNIVHASNYFNRVVESKMSYIRGYSGAKRLRPR
jgi:cell wall-associated NlpC family hydrolase